MGWLAVIFLAVALALVLGAEWPRLERVAFRRLTDKREARAGSKAQTDLMESFQRDLDRLPTISDDELRRKL